MNTIYLDEIPILYKTLENFCKKLDLDKWGSGAENWINELECKRRDGFVPHSYNRGGFDVYNILESVYEDIQDEEGYLIMHGFRFMYEGSKNGIHILCAYYCQWSEGDIYGINKAPTIAQIEIRFKKPERLFTKLTKFVSRSVA